MVRGRLRYLGLNTSLRTAPANRAKAVIHVRLVDGDGAGTAAVAVDGTDATLGVLEVDFGPDAVAAMRVVVGLGERERSTGQDCGLHCGWSMDGLVRKV